MHIRLTALAACLICSIPCAYAQERPRTVTVAGTGTATGEPDKARVTLTVQKSDLAMDKARDAAVAVTERFLVLTRKLRIDPQKIRTTGVTINPEYRWEQQTGKQILTGYMVQRTLEVEIVELDKLGALIEGAVSAGVNIVSPPVLDSSKRRELNRQALAAAAKDAEANARAVAETLGMRLGTPRELTAGDATPPPPVPMLKMRMDAAAEEGAAQTYEPGSLEFEARVNATFDLLPP